MTDLCTSLHKKNILFYMICLHKDLFNISQQLTNGLVLVMVELLANSVQIKSLLDMSAIHEVTVIVATCSRVYLSAFHYG